METHLPYLLPLTQRQNALQLGRQQQNRISMADNAGTVGNSICNMPALAAPDGSTGTGWCDAS